MADYKWSRRLHKILPWWLRTGEGGLVLRTVATVLGAFTERARQGLLTRGPTTCAPDALGYHGRDRRIVRGIDEPPEAYAIRLVHFLDSHRFDGNPFALHDELRAYVQADIRVRTVDRRGNWYTTDAGGARSVVWKAANWEWDAVSAAQWSRFWVILYPTADGRPWAASTAGAWPSGGTIGTTATPEQIASVRSIIRERKPAGTKCEWIIVAFDPASFDPAAPEPDGAWRYFGKPADGDPANVIGARLASARYWEGRST